MCFLERALAQSSLMGEKKMIDLLHCAFKKITTEDFKHRVCTTAADRVYPRQAS